MQLGAADADVWQQTSVLVYLVTVLGTTCGMLLGVRLVWSRMLAGCTCVIAALAAIPMLSVLPWTCTAITVAVVMAAVGGGLTQLRAMELQERRCFAAMYGADRDGMH